MRSRDGRLLQRNVTVADDHSGATGQQCLRGGVADAAGGAGDRDGLAPDVVHAAKLYTCQVLVGSAPDGIRARLAAAGVDWMGVSGDGFWRPDVRAQFLTDDGVVVLMHYTGLVEQTSRFAEAAEADEATDWAATPGGAELFPQMRPACGTPKPRKRSRSREKALRIARARSKIRDQRPVNAETRRTNRARKQEISDRKWRNHMRKMLILFKGTEPSTSPWCTWVNDPLEPEELPPDWKPPPAPPHQLDDEPPF